MTALHTKGPWCVLPSEEGVDYLRIRGTQLGLRYKIADVCSPRFDVPAEMAAAELAESLANARLMSMAPELLAELESTIEREWNPFEPENQSARYYRMIALRDKVFGVTP